MGMLVKVGRASEGAPLVITDKGIIAYGSAGGTNGGPAGALGVEIAELGAPEGGKGALGFKVAELEAPGGTTTVLVGLTVGAGITETLLDVVPELA